MCDQSHQTSGNQAYPLYYIYTCALSVHRNNIKMARFAFEWPIADLVKYVEVDLRLYDCHGGFYRVCNC